MENHYKRSRYSNRAVTLNVLLRKCHCVFHIMTVCFNLYRTKCSLHVVQDCEKINTQARFRVDDDTWPPDQPKNFTSLVLIQYKGHHNLQQAMAITQTGHIASLANHLPVPEDNQPLQEVLHNSTVTKKANFSPSRNKL